MISAFDRILIEVADLDAAVADYEVLLGPCERLGDTARLPLHNVCIELRPNGKGPAHIQGLSLLDDDLSGPEPHSNPVGLARRLRSRHQELSLHLW